MAGTAPADAHAELEYRFSGSVDDQTVAVDVHAKGTGRRGSLNAKVALPAKHAPAPVTVTATYGLERSGGGADGGRDAAADVSLDIKYAADKQLKLAADVKRSAGRSVSAHLLVQTPLQPGGRVEVTAKASRTDDNKAADGSLAVQVDDRKWLSTARVVLAEDRPAIELQLQRPEHAEPARFSAGVQRLGERKYAGHVLLANGADVLLDAKAEAGTTAGTWETLYATADIQSPAGPAKLKQVHAEVRAKTVPAPAVEVLVTANGKNVISGQAEYTVKQATGGGAGGGAGTEVEGKGSVKIFEQQKQANFVLRRGAEATGGVSLVFNANVGGVEKVNANVVLKAQDFQVSAGSSTFLVFVVVEN